MQHNSRKKDLLYLVYILLVLLPCLEIALLILGYRPYRQVDFKIESTPDNCLIPHPSLGFALHPGTFRVTINKGLTYYATHGTDSLRITSFAEEPSAELPAIWFLGCSYTYGMGLDDSLTFPFLVNKNLSSFSVKNFGVPGYGTVQGYLQLKQQLVAHAPPAWVMVNYADFHEERNALTPAYRRDLFMGYQRSNAAVSTRMKTAAIPYVTTTVAGEQIRFCSWDSIYHNWQYRETFASVNFLQDVSDQRQSRKIDKMKASLFIFQELKALCDLHQIRLLVTGITPSSETKQMLEILKKQGIETLDMSVDLSKEDYRNAPYDDHPNAKANAIFAKRITLFLSNQ
jgi:hypothetical protein